MAISLNAAAEIYREALREKVRKYAILFLSEGAVLIAAGLLVIFYPLLSSIGVATAIGWVLIASAILQLPVLFGMRSLPQVGLQVLAVVITLVIGFLLLRGPQQVGEAIIGLIITFLIVQGTSRVIFGLSVRPFPAWEAVAASGALGIVLALVLVGMLPEAPYWLIALLVGLELIAEGLSIGLLAWRVARREDTAV